MTFNIRHGEGDDGKLDLERIAAVIREARADLVALQEVDRGVERSGRRDLLMELSAMTGLRYTAFGKNIDHQGGDYGNAVLSRYPIVAQNNTPLRQLVPDERRGILQVLVDVQGRKLAFLSTHLDVRSEEERLLSIEQIIAEVLPLYDGYPMIMAGDLNTLPGSPVHRRISVYLKDVWEWVGDGPGNTYPVENADSRIDFLLVGEGVTPVSARVIQTPASDHLPILTEVTFSP